MKTIKTILEISLLSTVLGITGTGWSLAADTSQEQSVNLNSAEQERLESLTGIGPVKAQAILEYREEHGNFESFKDVDEVTGIGEKTLEHLREEATVEAPKAAPRS